MMRSSLRYYHPSHTQRGIRAPGAIAEVGVICKKRDPGCVRSITQHLGSMLKRIHFFLQLVTCHQNSIQETFVLDMEKTLTHHPRAYFVLCFLTFN